MRMARRIPSSHWPSATIIQSTEQQPPGGLSNLSPCAASATPRAVSVSPRAISDSSRDLASLRAISVSP